MICSKCGKSIQNGAKFCDACGASLERNNSTGSANQEDGAKLKVVAGIGWCLVALGVLDWLTGTIFGDLYGLTKTDAGLLLWKFMPWILGALGAGCIQYCRSKNAKSQLVASGAASDGEGAINGDSVRSALSSIKADGSVKYVEQFSDQADEKAVHGLKLSAGERPIVLFGKNVRVGELTALGWNGILFTDRAMYYKTYKYYANSVLAALGGQSVVKGSFNYASIKQLSIKAAEGEVYVYVNGAIIGRFVTTKKGADDATVAELENFCKNAMD